MFRIILCSLFLILTLCGNAAAEDWTLLTGDYTVSDLVIDGDILWAAAAEGVIRWDLHDNTHTLYEIGDNISLLADLVATICIDNKGVVWAGLHGGVIKKFDGDEWTTVEHGLDLGEGYINGSLTCADGSVWFSCNAMGLLQHKDSAWALHTDADGINLTMISSMTAGPDNTLYACNYDEGIAEFKNGGWTAYLSTDMPGYYSLTTGKDNTLWASGFDAMMYRFEGEYWTLLGEFDQQKYEEQLTGAKVNEAKQILNHIINLEVAYYFNRDEYLTFNYGDNCHEIGFTLPVNTNFEYKFEGDTAYARELVDLNNDGDTNDGLTLDSNKTQGTLDGSNYNWSTAVEIEYAQHMTTAPDGSIYAIARHGIRHFNGSSWCYLDMSGYNEDYPVNLQISQDNKLYVVGQNSIYALDLSTTAVEEKPALPTEIIISGNSPNPFNPETAISFTIPQNENISLAIFNAAGQKARTLHAGMISAGNHSIVWNGRDERGQSMSSGIYFAVLESGGRMTTHKMLLIR